MANKKQKSKSRLDKYYKSAKQLGYRSRAAFKLIQLNRKYGFLQKSIILVDLCAAPGGWLQVSSKFMPSQSQIIGIDLDKIRPIPGVKTFQQDITSNKCIQILKKQLGSHQADVFLNDGAPNVGGNWSKDSHIQCELVLASLKLACQFLRKGGYFLTKVFRSNDFNSLKWVLNKFFGKVDVTKPKASRNTSAQIFIVCQDYLSPDFIDPRLFDPAEIFKDTQADIAKDSGLGINSLKALLNKQKHRSGYDQNLPQCLSKTGSLNQFIKCQNPFQYLYMHGVIKFTQQQQKQLLMILPTPTDLKQLLKDTKLLGASDISKLIKWRAKVKSKIAQNRLKRQRQQDQDISSDQQLEIKILEAHKQEARQGKRRRQKTAKQQLKRRQVLQNQQQDQQMAQLAKMMRQQQNLQDLQYIDLSQQQQQLKQQQIKKPVTNLSKEKLEQALEQQYQHKRQRISNQKLKKLNKNMHQSSQFNQHLHKKVQAKRIKPLNQSINLKKAFGQDLIQVISEHDANVSFKNPLSKKNKNKPQFDDQFSGQQNLYDMNLPATQMQKRRKKIARQKNKQKQDNNQQIEIVPSKTMDDYNIQSLAQTLAIAKKMLRKRNRQQIINQSYLNPNRQDEQLPQWFLQDQRKHCFKKLPITKQQYQAQKQKLMAINARSSRKVLQAQFRKKRKQIRQMKKASKQASAVLQQQGVSQSYKVRQANKIFRRGMKEKKKEKKYIVGQKGKTLNKGSKKTKFVDSRLKKDKRAQRYKRIKKTRHVHRR